MPAMPHRRTVRAHPVHTRPPGSCARFVAFSGHYRGFCARSHPRRSVRRRLVRSRRPRGSGNRIPGPCSGTTYAAVLFRPNRRHPAIPRLPAPLAARPRPSRPARHPLGGIRDPPRRPGHRIRYSCNRLRSPRVGPDRLRGPADPTRHRLTHPGRRSRAAGYRRHHPERPTRPGHDGGARRRQAVGPAERRFETDVARSRGPGGSDGVGSGPREQQCRGSCRMARVTGIRFGCNRIR